METTDRTQHCFLTRYDPAMLLPDTTAVECFVAAARFLNFRAAAQHVSLTPAALGKRVAQLERQLGARLFQRTTRRVVLTPAGASLLPRAQALLRAAEDCARAVRGDAAPPPVDLVVGTRHELGLSWLVPLLDDLARALPHVTLHLYFSSGPDLELRVRTGEVDCAVTSRSTTDPKLTTQRLHAEAYVFVAAPGLLRRRPLRAADDLRAHTLIDAHAERPLFRYLRDAPRAPRVEPEQVRVLGTIAAIRQVVLKGRGVAVLPEYLVRADLARGRLVRLLPAVTPLGDHFRLLHRRDDPRAALFQTLASTLREHPLR